MVITGDLSSNTTQVLENKLRNCNQELEDVRERLSDRELEVEILQKRLSLRKSGSLSKDCSECVKKEAVISDLYEKMAQLEVTVEEICGRYKREVT